MKRDRILLLVFVLAAAKAYGAADCSSLNPSWRESTVKYVRSKYKLPDNFALTIAKDTPVAGTCFRELTFQGTSPLKTWDLKLYLSPDGRFLTNDLFDTSVDPVFEERTKMAELMSSLSQNKGASVGADDAPVTIVEFSDFECPYCRKFANILEEVLPSETGTVRVIFHHMPLSMHPWARTAAQGAACVQLQNSHSFWAMQTEIFTEQASITQQNVKNKLLDIAKHVPGLNLDAYQDCFDNDLSLGLVLRDIKLASSNKVEGTPTVFINGRRIQGVRDAAQLRQLISEAKVDSRAKETDSTSEAGLR